MQIEDFISLFKGAMSLISSINLRSQKNMSVLMETRNNGPVLLKTTPLVH